MSNGNKEEEVAQIFTYFFLFSFENILDLKKIK